MPWHVFLGIDVDFQCHATGCGGAFAGNAPRSLFLDFDDGLPPVDEMPIVKTHGSAVARELGRLARGIVITLRDPRDAVVPLMTSNRLPFEIALRTTEVSALTCAPFLRHPRHWCFALKISSSRIRGP